MKSTAKQRQDIGYMRKLLGLEDEVYYDMVYQYNGAKSSKDLSAAEATDLLNRLRDNGKSAGVFKPKAETRFKQYKYNNLGQRPGYASPAQLRKIEAMWACVTRAETQEARKKALNVFIKRITGKDNILFIESRDAAKLIKALSTMASEAGRHSRL